MLFRSKDAVYTNKLTGKVATHSWRKSYAKNIYELSGQDLLVTQEAMGHKSLTSTQSYLQVNRDRVNLVIAEMQKRLNK